MYIFCTPPPPHPSSVFGAQTIIICSCKHYMESFGSKEFVGQHI